MGRFQASHKKKQFARASRVEHYQDVRAQSIVAPVNLTISLQKPDLAKNLTAGECYYFGLLPPTSGDGVGRILGSAMSLFDSPYPVVRSNYVSMGPPTDVAGGFVDFLSARTRQRIIVAVAIICIIIFFCIFANQQSSTSNNEPSSQQEQKGSAGRR